MTTLWLTGLSGAGKTTLGNSVFNKLKKFEKVIILDGDELRKGLNSDLGFSMEDREENIRRVAHTAKMLYDNGFLVITTLISPTFHSRKMAREIARAVLPVSVYTEWYWKIDLHNLLHFLRLRLDQHAQYEIRVYAEVMAKIVKDAYPIIWEAFEDYKLDSMRVTKPEKELIAKLLKKKKIKFTEEEIVKAAESIGLTNKREIGEAVEKIIKLTK